MTYQFKVGDTGNTRNGRPYRVIATDLKSEDTIVAAITLLSGEEYVALRFATGKRFADGTSDADDLMPPTPASVSASLYSTLSKHRKRRDR
jgi:hypothetical protein